MQTRSRNERSNDSMANGNGGEFVKAQAVSPATLTWDFMLGVGFLLTLGAFFGTIAVGTFTGFMSNLLKLSLFDYMHVVGGLL